MKSKKYLTKQGWKEDWAKTKTDFKKAVAEALKEFIAMRCKEGEALSRDLRERLSLLIKDLQKIEKRAPRAIETYKKKLREKIGEIAHDEKLFREVIFYAEKTDITEELTRLSSHFKQFSDLLEEKEKSVGRTLDFLIQEMGREIHTLSAKTTDGEIVKIAIAMRGEIEKMREQAQNIE